MIYYIVNLINKQNFKLDQIKWKNRVKKIDSHIMAINFEK